MGQLRKLVAKIEDENGVGQGDAVIEAFRVGALITRDASSGGNVQVGVRHPGALAASDVCKVVRNGVERPGVTVTISDPWSWSAGNEDWETEVVATGGYDSDITAGDRLVLTGGSADHYVKYWPSDTKKGSSVNFQIGANSDGSIERWVDATDVDLKITNGGVTEYIFDVCTEGREYVTPEDFGAAGDGVTDDTQAIQIALDYASEIEGGGDVLFSKPSYSTTGNTVTSATVRCVGYGIPANITGGRPRLMWGSVAPEGNVVAPIGSLFQRTDGGAITSVYIKTSGTDENGWEALGGDSRYLDLAGGTMTGDIDMGGNRMSEFRLRSEEIASATTINPSANSNFLVITGTTDIEKIAWCTDGKVLFLYFNNGAPGNLVVPGSPANNAISGAGVTTIAQDRVVLIGYDNGTYAQWLPVSTIS